MEIRTGAQGETSSPPERAPLGVWRDERSRALSGVAAGIAARLNVDVSLVRLIFVVLCFAGGFGALAYVSLWAALPGSDSAPPPIRREPASPPIQLAALGAITLGLLLILRDLRLWFGDAVVWPFALAGLGAGVILLRSGPGGSITRAAGSLTGRRTDTETKLSPGRIGAGAALVVFGMMLVLRSSNVISAASSFIVPVAVTLMGVTLIFGPWLWNLGQQLHEERRERIRTEERAEVAAHLHDSVLQTLALIQRSDSPQEISSLARRQERELRAWLFDGSRHDTASLRKAADDLASRVESLHGVKVDVVVVGETSVDERIEAMLGACGEALTNAARHSGTDNVSLYIEVDDGKVSAFVRDTGKGFDPGEVPADRRGIAESIRARVERHHGTAEVVTSPGGGTEVRLVMPARLLP